MGTLGIRHRQEELFSDLLSKYPSRSPSEEWLGDESGILVVAILQDDPHMTVISMR